MEYKQPTPMTFACGCTRSVVASHNPQKVQDEILSKGISCPTCKPEDYTFEEVTTERPSN